MNNKRRSMINAFCYSSINSIVTAYNKRNNTITINSNPLLELNIPNIKETIATALWGLQTSCLSTTTKKTAWSQYAPSKLRIFSWLLWSSRNYRINKATIRIFKELQAKKTTPEKNQSYVFCDNSMSANGIR